jgi:hypothetical protein
MRLLFPILFISIIGCIHPEAGNESSWEKQKNKFKYKKKSEFVVDDNLLADLKNLKKMAFHVKVWIDTVYLYSWQTSDRFKNEFTVVASEGKYGPSIFYVITNKMDSLISSIKIAGAKDEGNDFANFKTVFVTKDTFFIDCSETKVSYCDTLNKYGTSIFGMELHSIDTNGQIHTILTITDPRYNGK